MTSSSRRVGSVRRCLAVLVMTLALGCGDDPPETSPADDRHGHGGGHGGESGIARHGGTEEAASEDREAPLARLVRTEGEVTLGGGVMTAGQALERGERVRVGPGGRADVDVREGARFALEPGADLRIGDVGPARVLLIEGAVHVSNPPEDGPRAILRIATPEASIAISGPGELYIVAHPSGTTVVMSLAGVFSVSNGESDARGRLREIDLATGRTVVVAQRMSEPVTGPQRLDDARRESAALLVAAPVVDDERRRHDLGAAIGRCDEALSALETEGRRGADLTSEHRGAVAAANDAEAMRLQGELVAHSTQLFRLREVATSRWERVHALRMTVTTPLEPDPVGVREGRVRGLLGD